jgi:hypothetical protein
VDKKYFVVVANDQLVETPYPYYIILDRKYQHQSLPICDEPEGGALSNMK